MSATAFTDVPEWPEQETAAKLDRHHNQPPLEDRVAMDFVDELTKEGLTLRIADITASAGRVPEIGDQATAGKVGDLIKQASAAKKRVEEIREVHNRPLLNAQRGLKARMDGLLADMDAAIRSVRQRLDAFIAEEDRKRREAQRLADEHARIAREAAEKAAREAEEAGRPIPAPAPIITPAEIEKPIMRGDMGASVSTRTVWRHEIEVPIAKLPKAILENAKVVEAIDSVIAAQIRAGTREIKGVKIWSETASAVR
jgi:hypothetical protein